MLEDKILVTLFREYEKYPQYMRIAVRLHLEGYDDMSFFPWLEKAYQGKTCFNATISLGIYNYMRDIKAGRLKITQRLKKIAKDIVL